MKKWNLRDWFLSAAPVTLAVLMAIFLAGCGGQQTVATTQAPETTLPPVSTTAPEASVEEEAPADSSAASESSAIFADGDTVGTGATSFSFTVINAAGEEATATICTDKTNLAEALQELGLIDGTVDDKYGLYVEEVNGEFHLYTVDGTDWYFYVNEKLSDADVDEITINPDDAYAFRVCQRPEPELRGES